MDKRSLLHYVQYFLSLYTNLSLLFVSWFLLLLLLVLLGEMSVLGEPEVGLLLWVGGVGGLVEGARVVGGEEEDEGDHGHRHSEHGDVVLKSNQQCRHFWAIRIQNKF